MRFIALAAAVICVSMITLINATDTESITYEALKKKNMKQLRVFLYERGEDCKGCAEKEDYVAKALAVKDKELIASKKIPQDDESNDGATKESFDTSKLEELLKGSGMNAKMFTADDLKDLSAEDLEAKFGGKGAGGRKKRTGGRKNRKNEDSSSSSSTGSSRSSSSSSRGKVDDTAAEEQHIEL